MSEISPERQPRRALSRRQHVLTSDDEDDENSVPPLGAVSTSQASVPSTRRAVRPCKTGASSALTDDDQSIMLDSSVTETGTPSIPAVYDSRHQTTAASASRRSVRAARKSRQSAAPEDSASLPTPQSSLFLEPQAQTHTPLADITESVNNEQTTPKPLKITTPARLLDIPISLHERPMDIVIRARARTEPAPQEPLEPKSRIVITYLILTNFKSYAGRQEVGPFHASFSSVVGPNGSGKSNVIDSLLFVFGFRASKMRQGKVSALIHNSAGFPDLGFCEVQVHFQEVVDRPTGEHYIIPGSSLVISRKAFKNNSSKYYINDSESNFTTVTTLLRDRGVDLDHKRFLILQGEVESIAQMKPKAATEHDDGLLEYLEDIIGTSKYKTPIEESAAETETLNAVCVEKNGRVQHVEKEKNGLEDKKDLALAFIRDENELAMMESALYQVYIQDCNDNIQVGNEAVATMQNQFDLETEKHRGNEEAMEELEHRYTSEKKQLEQLEKLAVEATKALASIDKEIVKYEEKKKHLNNKAKKLEKTAVTSQAATAEAVAQLDRLVDDLERNAAATSELQSELDVEEAELAAVRLSLTGKTQGLSNQIAAKQKSLEPWENHINQKSSAIAVAQSELTIIEERNSTKARGKAEIQSKITRLETEKAGKECELDRLKLQKTSLIDESHEAQALFDKLAKKEPDARLKLSSARQKADEARASLSKSQNQGNVLTGLMRLKESGRIQGFHGRLGNLGAIDERYDVAISTACPALDNLIVDTVEVGQQCIEYLRKNNMGRANFICLDRLTLRDLSPIDTPENAPRLYDLVRPKNDLYRAAFYSVLQNTIVAQDLQQANRLAYGANRWRVVTLDGQLIDKSGTMTGGGTRVTRGAMSPRFGADTTKEQMSKLEVEQSSLQRRLEEVQAEHHNAGESLRVIQSRLPGLDVEVQKRVLELQSIDRDLTDAQRSAIDIDNTRSERNPDQAHQADLEKKIATMEAEMASLQAETTETEAEIKSLQDKIMEIGGVKLRGQKAKVDGLRQRILTLTDEIASAEVSKVKTEKLRAKHEKFRIDAVAECENVNAELQQLSQETQQCLQEASGSRKQAEDTQEELELKEEELLSVKTELDKQTAGLNRVRALEIELRNKLDEHIKILGENRKRLLYWQDKLGKLTLQDVEHLEADTPQQELATYTKDELEDFDKTALKGDIAVLEERIQKANVDLGVLDEYRRRVEELTARSGDLAEAVASRDSAKRRVAELRRLRLEGFMEGFSTISLRLKEMYQMITMGGNAELELVDSLDPFSEGILFSVMPPKKSWKNISNLSGGEKTLSSLALVFALHHYKPTPLYVMDEIDAALDFRNVSIVASYIKERTKNAQFIVISLRNNMFELASRLVGVYKVNHMTKSVTVENRDYINR